MLENKKKRFQIFEQFDEKLNFYISKIVYKFDLPNLGKF